MERGDIDQMVYKPRGPKKGKRKPRLFMVKIEGDPEVHVIKAMMRYTVLEAVVGDSIKIRPATNLDVPTIMEYQKTRDIPDLTRTEGYKPPEEW